MTIPSADEIENQRKHIRSVLVNLGYRNPIVSVEYLVRKMYTVNVTFNGNASEFSPTVDDAFISVSDAESFLHFKQTFRNFEFTLPYSQSPHHAFLKSITKKVRGVRDSESELIEKNQPSGGFETHVMDWLMLSLILRGLNPDSVTCDRDNKAWYDAEVTWRIEHHIISPTARVWKGMLPGSCARVLPDYRPKKEELYELLSSVTTFALLLMLEDHRYVNPGLRLSPLLCNDP